MSDLPEDARDGGELEIIDLETATAHGRQSIPRPLKRTMTFAIGIGCLVLTGILLSTLLPPQRHHLPASTPTTRETIPVEQHIYALLLVRSHTIFEVPFPLPQDQAPAELQIIEALNLDTGARLWQFQTALPIQGLNLDEQNGLVIVKDITGVISAISAYTGRVIWKFKSGTLDTFITTTQNMVLVQSSGRMLALRTSNGSIIWKRAVSGENVFQFNPAKLYLYNNVDMTITILDSASGRTLSSYHTTGSILHHEQDTLYIAESNTAISAVRLSDGKALWRYQFKNAFEYVPEFSTGMLYLFTSTSEVIALDANTGKEVWEAHEAKDSAAIVLDSNNTAFAIFNRSAMSTDILRGSDGKLLWHNAQPIVTIAASSATSLYIATRDGTASRVESTTGHVYWQTRVQKYWIGIDPAAVYLLSNTGLVLALRLSDGSTLWSTSPGTQFFNGLLQENMVLLYQANGEIEACRPDNGKIIWQWKAE